MNAQPTAGTDIEVRHATEDDLEAILTLGQRCLGWLADQDAARFFMWKHRENPFGESPMWVAEIDGRIAGFRTFLRWDLVSPTGVVSHAVRAVDTATDPEFQGRGIFTKLTLAGIDELRDAGIDFVFNTPNDQSRPGYLKMGWQEVGRLKVAVRPTGLASIPAIARARLPASSSAVAVNLGSAASEVLADATVVERLLAAESPRAGLATCESPEYFAWRYGLSALHYRAVTAPEGPAGGLVVFHLRRRGPALEAVIGRVLTGDGRERVAAALLAQIAREAGADYLIRLESSRWFVPRSRMGFVPVPRVGPLLTVRRLNATPPTELRAWDLGMGEIEVF